MQRNGNNHQRLLILVLLRGGTSMDRIVWLSALTYFLLIASLIFSYYVSKGRYRTIVIVIGIGSLTILTWALINGLSGCEYWVRVDFHAHLDNHNHYVFILCYHILSNEKKSKQHHLAHVKIALSKWYYMCRSGLSNFDKLFLFLNYS